VTCSLEPLCGLVSREESSQKRMNWGELITDIYETRPSHPSVAGSSGSLGAAMPELQWLDGYNGETVDELIALEGKYRTDSLVLAFEQAMDQKASRIGAHKLTAEERVILAVEALEREVNNGGYGQFFVNSSREYAPVIVDALRRIGCSKTAEITHKALKIVEKTPMTDEEIENGTWEENEERQEELGECDTLYFERPENIEESLFVFIKANRTKIEP
jgi:uncharacterized protein DUF4375